MLNYDLELVMHRRWIDLHRNTIYNPFYHINWEIDKEQFRNRLKGDLDGKV